MPFTGSPGRKQHHVSDPLPPPLSLSEIPFSLRRWHLTDGDPVVRACFHAVFDVPLPRCAGVGAHGSPAPDRGPEALCPETAEADCRRPSVLGVPVPGLGRLARGVGLL